LPLGRGFLPLLSPNDGLEPVIVLRYQSLI
jgi:hypothetical protein